MREEVVAGEDPGGAVLGVDVAGFARTRSWSSLVARMAAMLGGEDGCDAECVNSAAFWEVVNGEDGRDLFRAGECSWGLRAWWQDADNLCKEGFAGAGAGDVDYAEAEGQEDETVEQARLSRFDRD